MNEPAVKLKYSFHTMRTGLGAPVLFRDGPGPKTTETTRVPRISRLVALAHRFQSLLATGEVSSMAELAKLGRVTRARITQIMDLLLLAPDVQETLLFLPSKEKGRDPITLRELRYVCQTPVWAEQRARWAELGVDSEVSGRNDHGCSVSGDRSRNCATVAAQLPGPGSRRWSSF